MIDAPKNVRLLKEIALEYDALQHTLVLVSHAFEIPPEIKRYCAYFQLTLPSTSQLENLIYLEVDKVRTQGMPLNVDDKAVIKLAENLRGVTLDDARRLIHKAIVDDGAITHSDVDLINKAKFQLLDLNGILQFEYDTSDFSQIAGLHNLKKMVKTAHTSGAGNHRCQGRGTTRCAKGGVITRSAGQWQESCGQSGGGCVAAALAQTRYGRLI